MPWNAQNVEATSLAIGHIRQAAQSAISGLEIVLWVGKGEVLGYNACFVQTSQERRQNTCITS
jgi:hypothetical protein